MFLHIVLLEKEKLLLHVSVHNKDTMHNIIQECELIYNYALLYKPLRIVETIVICQNDEINFFVKKYMKYYGIDNVRGGSYINNELTDMERSNIVREQLLNFETIKLQCDSISDVAVKYNDIDTWSTYKIKLTYETCIKQHNNYENEKQMLHNFTVGYQNIAINRILLADLTWLSNECAKAIKLAPYCKRVNNKLYEETKTIQKYKNIVIKIKSIYTMFTDYMEETNTYQPLIHLYSPETILDQYFYNPSLTQCILQYENLIKYLSMCEYMAYCIICRIQEYTFDVNSYPSNFEMSNKYEIAFLEKHISEFLPISCGILHQS
jgi:hypothetical protein